MLNEVFHRSIIKKVLLSTILRIGIGTALRALSYYGRQARCIHNVRHFLTLRSEHIIITAAHACSHQIGPQTLE